MFPTSPIHEWQCSTLYSKHRKKIAEDISASRTQTKRVSAPIAISVSVSHFISTREISTLQVSTLQNEVLTAAEVDR